MQTVSVAPGGVEWLRVGSNGVYRPLRTTVSYSNGVLLQPGSRKCERIPQIPGIPVAVDAPNGLCGQGAVRAIGTWRIRNGDREMSLLFDRLMNWLAGTIGLRYP